MAGGRTTQPARPPGGRGRNRAAEPGNEEAGGAGPRLRKEARRTAPPEPHQVDGVEDLHLPDGGAARIRQVTVVVVDGQGTQACEQHRAQSGSGRGPGSHQQPARAQRDGEATSSDAT